MQRLFLIFSKDKTRLKWWILFPSSTSTKAVHPHDPRHVILITMLHSRHLFLPLRYFLHILVYSLGLPTLSLIMFTTRSTCLLPSMIIPTFEHQQMDDTWITLTLSPGMHWKSLASPLSLRSTRIMHLSLGTSWNLWQPPVGTVCWSQTVHIAHLCMYLYCLSMHCRCMLPFIIVHM